MEQDIAEIVEEIEKEKALGKISAVQVFRGMLNQPELLSVSSANAEQTGSSYAYSQFNVNMPRPVLEAETLQLLAANIPLCTQNFPDTACTFWYYRTDEYSGNVPNTENLFFVRLLPSYYKPEFISAGLYGFNQTFDTYNAVASQLSLSCTNDLAYDNLKYQDGEDTTVYQLHYIPSDVSITYNSAPNKFQMTGLNTPAPLVAYSAANTYAAGTTYAAGAYVSYNHKVYRSLQAGNVGHTPGAVGSSTWWTFVTDKLVVNYAVGTSYRKGQYVANGGGTIYVANNDIYASGSFSTGSGWVIPDAEFNYRYLVTGYADPNVALLQNTSRRQWNQYALFETGDIVQYQGQSYQAIQQNKGWLPFQTSSASVYSIVKTDYKRGAVVYYTLYSSWWKCISDNPPANSITVNPFTCSDYWIPSYWSPQSDNTGLPIVGLNTISSQFDMNDTFGGGQIEYPFPYGVPGQPFNPNPRRLLNSLLGFCWNGLFDPTAVNDVLTTTNVSTSSITTDFLNRLRPVPQYYVRYGVGGLGEGRGTTAITYTADGYANLVYTSIVAIYSTIVYGSTLDSQRNTNLIGLSSMNAGNLGVSFFDNKINGPLRVKGSDIYSIGIELRDEMNEPYPLWNSAVATFTLKLTYKENLAEK